MTLRSLLIVIEVVALIRTSSAFLTSDRPRDGASAVVAQANMNENMISLSVSSAYDNISSALQGKPGANLADVDSKEKNTPLVEKPNDVEGEEVITDEVETGGVMQELETELKNSETELKVAEEAYRNYLQEKNKPFGGKFYMNELTPVYDKETERLQTEIWAIKEQILLLRAELSEERIKSEYKAQLHEKDLEVKRMRKDFVHLFAEKQKELDALREDMHNLISQLQDKRKQIKEMKWTIATVKTQLQENESEMEALQEERESIRKLTKQSGRILKSRFQQLVLGRDHVGKEDDDDVDDHDVDDNVPEDAGDKIRSEKVLVTRGRFKGLVDAEDLTRL